MVCIVTMVCIDTMVYVIKFPVTFRLVRYDIFS